VDRKGGSGRGSEVDEAMGTGFAKLFDQMKIHRTFDIDGIFKYVQLICTFRMKIHKAQLFWV